MTAGIYHITKYYCAALVAMIVLTSPGCDINPVQCDTGPGNAIYTVGGTVAGFVLKDSSEYATPTYTMTVAQPDIYLRWKTTSNEFGITTIFCLGTYWDATFADDWQHVVIWAGSSTPICGDIRSLKVALGTGSLTAEVRLKRAEGNTLVASASQDLVLALGRTCPSGTCSGKIFKSQCFEPYASVDNATYASLQGADLNFASMSGRCKHANLTGASLSHATLDGADLSDAKLDQASLSSATLNGATLRTATLTGASLDNATLTNADLNQATLNNAVLSNANLTGADMHDVAINGAVVNQTIAPDGVTVNSVTELQMHSLIP